MNDSEQFPYDLVVTGEGKPVVLLNGLLQTSDSWVGFSELLSTDRMVIRYSLRNQGHIIDALGTTDRAECHVDDLEALLNKLNIHRTALVGQSFGARLAIDFAARNPDRVECLVLLAGSSHLLANRNRMIFESWRDAVPDDDQEDWINFSERVCPWAFSVHYLSQNPDFPKLYAAMIPRAHTARGVRANISMLIAANTPDIAARYSAIRCECPALVMNGAHDYLTPPDTLDPLMRILPRGSLVIIDKCGHAVSAEAGPEFERRALEFLVV